MEKQKEEAKSHELQAGASQHTDYRCNSHGSTQQSSRCSVVSPQVKEAVEEERRRCEAEQVGAARAQRQRLEEQVRHSLQPERSVALALKQEAAELRTVRPLAYDHRHSRRGGSLCFISDD